MPDDHGALEVAMGLWTDADFLAIAEAQARAAADAGAQQDLDHLEDQRRYFAEKRFLAQWEASGFHGKRPQLSFELQAVWQAEKDREREQIERDRQQHLVKLERLEEQRREAERKRLEKEEWRKANPELAAQQDAEEAAERERRRQERETQAAIKAMETALQERKDRIRAFVHHHSPQELDADDFLFWAETLATPEELEAFDQDCLKRARGPGSKGDCAQSMLFGSWLPWLSTHATPDP